MTFFCVRKTPALMMALIMISLYASLAGQRWHTYTNTNHVTDIIITDSKIYTATWGGVVEYDKTGSGGDKSFRPAYVRTITSVDGLADNDVRTLAYQESTGDLWAGTASSGITIIKPTGLLTLNVASGQLPSNQVRRIAVYGSYIYVATDQGISQFYYLPQVYIPLPLHQYNETNTQGGLADNDVRDITVSENGYLYCATASGVSFVHTDSLDLDTAWHNWHDENSPLPGLPVLSLSVSANYIAMNTLTSVHRHGSDPFASDWHTWTRNSSGLVDSVFTVKIYDNGLMLLSYGVWNEETMNLTRKTPHVLSVIEGTGYVDFITPPADEPLPESCIYRFILYPSQALVYATWGQGTFWDGSVGYFHLEDNCIGFQTVSEIVADANHNLWLASGWLGGGMTQKGTRGVSKWSDGNWTTYTTKNSPLPSDNIRNLAVDFNNKKWFGSWDASGQPYNWRSGAVAYDDADEAWQWYTRTGIRTYIEADGWSESQPGTPTILNNTIADIYVDRSGNILISSSGAGITAFDLNYNLLGTFQMPSSASVYQSVSFICDSGSRYFFGLNVDDKLAIWDDPSLPIGSGDHWLPSLPPDLNNGFVYGVVSILSAFDEEENWIATSSGLYMWDGTNWYRYDTDIKRRRYSGGTWVNETLYYVDEERLFGSVRTTPTALFKDPFGRIWIGSLENGLTMYDPDTERFTNYYQGNAPLLSNYVTCFGYDPLSGNLLIGTPDGLNTLEIGIEIKTQKQLNTVKAFPNPFRPEQDGFVRLVNLPSLSMPAGTNVCRIYDAAGSLVIELKENYYARFDWNGYNKNRKKCSSGIYFFAVTAADGTTKKGKFALIRSD